MPNFITPHTIVRTIKTVVCLMGQKVKERALKYGDNEVASYYTSALRSDGRGVGAGGGGRRRIGLVVDHFLHLLLLVATPVRLDSWR